MIINNNNNSSSSSSSSSSRQNNNRLLESCSRKPRLDNDTYTCTYYKMHKIHNNSHTTKYARKFTYVDQAVQ